MSRVNLGGAMSLLQRPTISPEAFNAPAKGLQALAQGIGSIAGATEKAMKAALHLQDLVDDDKVFKAKMAFRDFASAGRQEIEANPENYTQYGEIIKRHMEEGYHGFLKEHQDLSERARQRIEQEYIATSGELYGRAQEMAVRKATENVRQRVLMEAGELAAFGDGEAAAAIMEEERGRGRFNDFEIDSHTKGFRKQATVAGLDQMRLSRPDLSLKLARDEKKTPELSPQERLREERASRAAIAARDAELMDEVVVAFDRGEVESVEDVRKRFGEYGVEFAERNLASLKRALQKREISDFGEAREIVLQARTMELPEDDLERAELRDVMRARLNATLLPGDGEELKARFDEVFSGGARKPLDQQISRWENDIIDLGGFGGGYDRKKANDGDPTEIERRTQTFLNLSKAQQQLADWRKNHPQASDEEVRIEFQKIIQNNGWMPEPKDSRWFWQRWWGDKEDASEDTFQSRQPPASNPYKSGGQEWRARQSSLPLPEGSRITSYGYTSDPYKDSNSLAGVGAFVSKEEQRRIKAGLPSEKRLRPGDFAVSPDVEKAMKAAGVKPEEAVRIELSDGTWHVGRWMDRTMQDEQAIRRYGKPLRGRIDLYSPDGVHEKDGVSVVGWSKV